MTETLLPLTLVIAVACFAPRWRREARLQSALLATGFCYVLARYLWWRLTETVLPAEGSVSGVAFVWIVFVAELWLWFETLTLALILSRRIDRSPEADRHEIRLRNLPPNDLPDVDVFIATYNEPIDVLEKTIAGARAIDWPASRLHIYVLDDGKREWLARYCREQDITHITRENNAHAKAGNINAAIPRTQSPFILILDADFVPQPRMLMRSIGFFNDPRIGIVQMPHFFFNNTPLQTNMDLRQVLPDEQRFFFDVIQPGRDGWDCGFCCGSNGIIRRSALKEIGNAIPTESITEDMLLTLALLRKGYVTRYLGERLAVGLAPESLEAYFVQRERWSRGAIQMLYTKHGPIGPGLTVLQRLFFSPSHWLSQSVCQPIAMLTPAVFMLTGQPPFVGATLSEIVNMQLPAIAAAFAFLGYLAPREFAPVASTVESVLQSFRLLPSVLWTLFKPHGHAFRVTPKGSGAGGGKEDRFTILTCLVLIALNGCGLLLNSSIDTRVIENAALLPVVAFWAMFNMFVLLVVLTASVPRVTPRSEERFPLERACRLRGFGGSLTGRTQDVSISGALIELDYDPIAQSPTVDDWLVMEIAGIGEMAVQVQRSTIESGVTRIGVRFHRPEGDVREALLQALFAGGLEETPARNSAFGILPHLLAKTFGASPSQTKLSGRESPKLVPPPDWVLESLKASNKEPNTGFRRTSTAL